MELMNMARVFFLIFFSVLLGIALARGNAMGASFDVAFVGFNLFRLYQEYEEENL